MSKAKQIQALKNALNEACDEIMFYSDFTSAHIKTKNGLYERVAEFRELTDEENTK